MDDQTREELVEQLKELDDAMAQIDKARLPFDRAMSALYGQKERLLERHEADIAGSCEGCSDVIFMGEPAHIGEEMMFCEACAPTWADCKKSWEEALERGDVDEEEALLHLSSIEARIAEGLSLDDKHVWPA